MSLNNHVPFSASRLKDYEQCPKKFFHKHIRKDAKEPKTDAQDFGTFVHESFEKAIRDGAPLPQTLNRHAPVVDRFRKVKQAGTPVHVEKKMALNRGLSPVAFFDKDVDSRAVADVLVAGKELVVVDWKTGKIREDDAQQLNLTISMALLHFPSATSAKGLLYYTQTGDFTPSNISAEDAVPVYSTFRAKADKITEANNRGEWPAKPSPLCNWCPVSKDKCQHR